MSSDLDKNQSDLSHVSLGDDRGQKRKGGGESSDSESSDNAMDETADSLQDGLSSLESQPGSSRANTPVAPSEDSKVSPNEKTAAAEEARNPEDAPGNPDEGVSHEAKSTQDQTLKTAPADPPAQQPMSEDGKSTTPQSDPGKEKKATNLNDQKTDKKNKNKKDTATTQQPTLDQNANEDPNVKQTGPTKQKGKNQQDQKQKQGPAAGQQMVSGSQSQSKVILIMFVKSKYYYLQESSIHFVSG